MKFPVALVLALTFLLSACGGPGPVSNSGDYELRSATPGVVDHNVIPKKK